jgi:hypothetical protein
MLIRFLQVFFLSITAQIAYSQFIQQPLQGDHSRREETNSRFRITSTPIDTLPFFDDFAGYHGNPKSQNWEQGGGVFVNNTFGINPPSYHVATFDGLKADGKPYNPKDKYANGLTDNLTSVPLNLEKYEPKDSLYISFFWQAGGHGENPDPSDGDYLALEFKDSSDKWTTIWKEQDINTPFEQVIKPILDPKYFHSTFQFRFQSYGSTFGANDVWNLDYILLAPNRTAADTNYADFAILNTPGSMLKNYSAIPYHQFYNHISSQVKEKLSFKVFNYNVPAELYLMNNDIGQFNTLKNKLDDSLIEDFKIETFAFGKTGNIADWEPDYSKLANLNQPLLLKYHYTPSVTDSSLFSANNTVADSTFILNYFAYDDHSAESSFSLQTRAGVAVAFQSLQPDSIVGVAIDFLPFETDLSGNEFEIFLWNSVTPGKTTESAIASQKVHISYSTPGSIARFYFANPVAINGEFLVGFKSEFNFDRLYVGFDLNNNSSDKIRYMLGDIWYDYKSQSHAPGSIMIRPIFGGDHYVPILVTNKPKPNEDLIVQIYPNPNKGSFTIDGKITEYKVYNLSGLLVEEQKASVYQNSHHVNLDTLPNGVYFIHLTNRENTTVQKIIINK